MGFDADTALTLGKAVAGLNARSKGRSLGIFKPPKLEPGKPPKKRGVGEEFWVDLCGRAVPAKSTADGVRAVVKDKPIDPGQVRSYLERSFGTNLPAVKKAMAQLASTFEPGELAQRSLPTLRALPSADRRRQTQLGPEGGARSGTGSIAGPTEREADQSGLDLT